MADVRIEKLKGYVTFGEAARMLGCTKPNVELMALHNGKFQTVFTVGDKPTYVLRESEVRQLVGERAAAAAEQEFRVTVKKEEAEQRKAIRAWAQANGHKVPQFGAIPSQIVAEYQAANG